MKRNSVLGVFILAVFVAAMAITHNVSADKQQSKATAEQDSPSAVNAIFVEDFTSPAGTLLTSAGWTAHSAGGTNPIAITSPGLTYTGYPSAGNAVTMTTSGEDDNHVFPTQTSGSVYASILVNVTDAAVDASGGYFFHLGPDPISTTFRGRLYIKKDASNNIAFGITKAGASLPGDIAFTGSTFALNTTYLLVIKYTVVAGATNDTVSLLVNPALGGAEPAATVTAPDVGAGDINPGSVALRQGTAATSPTIRADGIRVANSWASLLTPAPARFLDFNGDGRTDYGITRNEGGLMRWYIALNGSPSFLAPQWGISSDHEVPADYDGDGKADVAVFRDTGDPTRAYFYILRSSNATVQIEQFGISGDQAARVIGDWDGDGKADVAVMRQNDNVPCGVGRLVFYWRPSGSPGTNFSYGCWGIDTDSPYTGDFDGDGRMDLGVIRRPGGQNTVYIRRSSDQGIEGIAWGNLGDTYFPCDFDGDGKSDFCVVRLNGTNAEFYVLTRTGGGTGASPIIFGNINPNSDQLTFGDFDGDGRTDIGLLHPSGGSTTFIYRRTADGGFSFFPWGLTGDHSIAEEFAGGSGS